MSWLSEVFGNASGLIRQILQNKSFQQSAEDGISAMVQSIRDALQKGVDAANAQLDKIEANKSKIVGSIAANTPAEQHADASAVQQAKQVALA